MKRTFFNVLTCVALLVWLAIVTFWYRSYSRCDVLMHQSGPADRAAVTSEFGKLVFELEAPQHAAIQPGWVYFGNPLPRRWNQPPGLLGFTAYHTATQHYILLPPTPVKGITIPYWFLACATSALPLLWLAGNCHRRIIRRRNLRGLCPACGYDLRASSDRCPECGGAVVRTETERVGIEPTSARKAGRQRF